MDGLELVQHPQHVLRRWSSRRARARRSAGRHRARSGAPSRGRSAPARAALRLCGSQITPPLPPPSGMSTTEHFQVIHVASARTVSRSLRVKADAALARAARVVVLNAESAKYLDVCRRPSAPESRTCTRASASAAAPAWPASRSQQVGHLVKLRLRHLERVHAFARHAAGPPMSNPKRPSPARSRRSAQGSLT